ncbi:Membrane protein involved in the export of O-antigen and teichoic acid [Monaibacterium marinum]|uniref:Membrane protein involved in the export of O-antigen and teichoic acid n=2 Tax=Pontivivens marinum TaxID=1690039 RepID=A0A2C9CW00_9RHOB|nr:Membrane protein involved in the export of O-antigen and teichoic acid [Monaibacterium marinum]
MRQIGGLGAANVVYLISQLGVLSLLTNLTNIHTVAEFGYIMAVVQPLYMLFLMGLRPNLSTDINREFRYSTFLSVQSISSILLVFISLIIISFLNADFIALAVPICVMKAVEMHSELCYGVLQRAGRIGLVARSLLIRGPVLLLCFGLVLYITRDAQTAFWVQTIILVLVQIMHDFPAVRKSGEYIRIDPSIRRICSLTQNTFHLGIGHFFASLQTNIPRFIVYSLIGTVALSYYTTISLIQRASVGLFVTIEQAIGSHLSKLWIEGNRRDFFARIRTALYAAALVSAVGMGLAYLIGKPFLNIAFGPEYVQAYGLLMWISAAIALRLISAVIQAALIAQRNFRIFRVVQTASLLTTIPFTVIGIHYFGLNGAGMAMVATTLFRTAYFSAVLYRA